MPIRLILILWWSSFGKKLEESGKVMGKWLKRQKEEEGLSHWINNLSQVPSLVAITLVGKVNRIVPVGWTLSRSVLFPMEVSASSVDSLVQFSDSHSACLGLLCHLFHLQSIAYAPPRPWNTGRDIDLSYGGRKKIRAIVQNGLAEVNQVLAVPLVWSQSTIGENKFLKIDKRMEFHSFLPDISKG